MRYAVRSLIVVFVLGVPLAFTMWGRAQTPQVQVQLPTIVLGNDVGFRVERWKGSTPVGRLVVRIGGQWVDAEFAMGAKRLTAE